MKVILFTLDEFILARHTMKLSQEELGKLLGCTGNHISKVEAGIVPLSMKLQLKLYGVARKQRAIQNIQPVIVE